jgi:purine nucleoside permease
MRPVTDGKGAYCTTQQEDNLAVQRAGLDSDRPYEGQTAPGNLLAYSSQGGSAPATENLTEPEFR